MARVAALVPDLLFGSKVQAALEQAGHEVDLLTSEPEAMVRGGFRHLVVVDGGEMVGVLSMRDIVRCWVADGATSLATARRGGQRGVEPES